MANKLGLAPLVSLKAQAEFNSLFWVEPFNSKDGKWDAGWSCREHAWAFALLAHMVSIPATIIHGHLTVVTPGQSHSLGIIYDVLQHSWAAVEDLGFFDLSVKPIVKTPGFPEFQASKTAYGQLLPKSFGSSIVVRSEIELGSQVEKASSRQRMSSIYFGRQYDILLPEIVSDACGYLNSPLTDELRTQFDETIYAKGLLHLHGAIFRGRTTLTGMRREEAWDRIDHEFSSADAVARVISIARLAHDART